MTPLTLSLVVLAAFVHASWNLLMKRSADAGISFVICSNVVSCVAYLPWAVWVFLRNDSHWGWAATACVAASGAIHLAYSLSLQRGYQVADLSVVYPVARGTGPLVSTVCAFLLLHERPSTSGLAGTAAILLGIAMIATQGNFRRFANPETNRGVRHGTATGALIASYTVVDAYGVKDLNLHPVILDWCSSTVRLFMFLPWLLGNSRRLKAAMRGHLARAVFVGLLTPLSYIMVLGALRLGAPLSLVAPAREMSMMIGSFLGLIVLRERMGFWRGAGCAAMLAGVVLIGLS